MTQPEIAIIGAGMAGAACAEALAQAGHEVQLFDKGRSVGGRLAQRRRAIGTFDHGAQYMTARDPGFMAACTNWHERGLLEPWSVTSAESAPRWIGVPGMNTSVKAMLEGLAVATGVRIGAVERRDTEWLLTDEEGRRHGPFEGLVIAIPPVQAVQLIGDHAFRQRLEAVAMAPCWAAMFGFHEPFDAGFEAMSAEEGAIAWAALNSTKTGRAGKACWTIHASAEWSTAHLEDDPFDIGAPLLGEFTKLVGAALPDPDLLEVHRWRYAMVTRPLGEACLYDREGRLGLAGDWCLGPRVEAAYLSGRAMAREMFPEEMIG